MIENNKDGNGILKGKEDPLLINPWMIEFKQIFIRKRPNRIELGFTSDNFG